MKAAKATTSLKETRSDSPETARAQASGTLTREDLDTLKAAFPKDRLGVKVQSYSKDRTKAMLVLYLQHTDVQDRIEEVDPAWSCEVIAEERVGDTVYARSRLTVKGVSRENVGEGGDPKAAYSDALKRCAMLFGIGRYLYDSPTVWVAYDDSRDRFKQWSVDDYEAAARRFGGSAPLPKEPKEAPGLTTKGAKAASKKPAEGPKPEAAASHAPSRPREELNRVLMNLYRPYLVQFPQTQFAQLLQTRYDVAETRLMTVEQLEDLIGFMEQKLQSVA